MYCNNCGKFLLETDKFCSNCGAKVVRSEQNPLTENEPASFNPDGQAPVPPKPTPPTDNIKWNIEDFPGHDVRKTEDINFDWGNTSVFKKPDPQGEEIALNPGQRTDQTTPVEGGFVSAEPEQEDIIQGKDLEEAIFAEASLVESIPAGGDAHKRTKIVDKFYTFNKKNEEFQKLLDKEYEKMKAGEGEGLDDQYFRDQVSAINQQSDELWSEFNPTEHLAEMALARERFFGPAPVTYDEPKMETPPAPAEPIEATEEPAETIEEPIEAAEEPAETIEEPVEAAEEPDAPTEEPVDEPTAQIEEPAALEEEQPTPAETQEPEPAQETIPEEIELPGEEPLPEQSILPDLEICNEEQILHERQAVAEASEGTDGAASFCTPLDNNVIPEDFDEPNLSDNAASQPSGGDESKPVEDDVLSIRDKWIKYEEDEEEEDEERSGGKVGKIIIAILIIILLAEVVLMGIWWKAPNSAVGQFVNEKLIQITEFFQGSENSIAMTPDRTIAAEDKTGLIQMQIDENYNSNIAVIKYNAELRLNLSKDYEDTLLNESTILEDNVWYKDADGGEVYYDDQVIGAIIAHESTRRLAEGETFATLEIGEIRINGNDLYVWVAEEITPGQRQEKIFRVTVSGETMDVITEYDV